jgi:hypothetical protein
VRDKFLLVGVGGESIAAIAMKIISCHSPLEKNGSGTRYCLPTSAGRGAHLWGGFIGCGEFQKFLQCKKSQFGFGKRLINR